MENPWVTTGIKHDLIDAATDDIRHLWMRFDRHGGVIELVGCETLLILDLKDGGLRIFIGGADDDLDEPIAILS